MGSFFQPLKIQLIYLLLLLVLLVLLLLSRFSRVRLCNPTDSSPPGSPIPGILQARTLEWVAISSPIQYSILTHIYGI